jgi:hypothetical protein
MHEGVQMSWGGVEGGEGTASMVADMPLHTQKLLCLASHQPGNCLFIQCCPPEPYFFSILGLYVIVAHCNRAT